MKGTNLCPRFLKSLNLTTRQKLLASSSSVALWLCLLLRYHLPFSDSNPSLTTSILMTPKSLLQPVLTPPHGHGHRWLSRRQNELMVIPNLFFLLDPQMESQEPDLPVQNNRFNSSSSAQIQCLSLMPALCILIRALVFLSEVLQQPFSRLLLLSGLDNAVSMLRQPTKLLKI